MPRSPKPDYRMVKHLASETDLTESRTFCGLSTLPSPHRTAGQRLFAPELTTFASETTCMRCKRSKQWLNACRSDFQWALAAGSPTYLRDSYLLLLEAKLLDQYHFDTTMGHSILFRRPATIFDCPACEWIYNLSKDLYDDMNIRQDHKPFKP